MTPSRRTVPCLEDAVPFKIDGEPCRLIPLTKGQYAIVDAFEYGRVMRRHWQAKWDRKGNCHYATSRGRENLHAFLSGIKGTDHRNGNTLDDRHSNLRDGGGGGNNRNARRRKDNTTGFKGVERSYKNSFRAMIQADGKRHYLGYFDSAVKAAKAYDAGAIKYHGEFACLNFPR